MKRSRSRGLAQGSPSRISRRDILVAARRHYELGDTQASIAADMGISASYLARLLKEAEAAGWIKFIIEADRETELAAELLHKYPSLVHAEVVADPPDASMRAKLTPRDLGIAMAAWFNTLLDNDEEGGNPQIWNVAIGGSAAMTQMVERILPRPRRVSVGPTSLTPFAGRVERAPAPILALQLGVKLGALTPGERNPPAEDVHGHLYFGAYDVPRGTQREVERWFDELPNRPGFVDISRFWNDLDVAFVSAVPLTWRYSDLPERLKAVGASVEELAGKGGSVLFANRVLNEEGNDVHLSRGVPSYEPCVPTESLRACGARHRESGGRRGFVVLEAWGGPGRAAMPALRAGLANVLFCDATSAKVLIV